jgi:hypothetical protein
MTPVMELHSDIWITFQNNVLKIQVPEGWRNVPGMWLRLAADPFTGLLWFLAEYMSSRA